MKILLNDPAAGTELIRVELWPTRISSILNRLLPLGLPTTLGGLGSWYDGATFALEAQTPALMYGPRHIDWAHTVGEYVPIDDLVHCAQGIAVAGLRLCG